MGFCIQVEGEYACFTRPEMKVERVSYDVITPSAARAIFEAILWKPAINWQVNKIEVLQPIRWVNIRRNEVGGVVPVNSVSSAIKSGTALALYVEEQRQQRAGLLLRDVAYRLHADFNLGPRAGGDDSEAKFAEMFRRRASKGQCFNQPYLGTREFSCEFSLVEPLDTLPAPIDEDRELGWMLYDINFDNADQPLPLFFNAKMRGGSINVPSRHSPEVRG